MLRRIHLHGPFRAAAPGGVVEITGETVAECIEGMSRQLSYFAPDAVSGMKRLQVVGHDTEASLYQPLGDTVDIHIVPAVVFGKDGGVIETIIGVTLIVVGIAMGGVFWPAIFIQAGMALALGGVAQMLAPQPQGSGSDDDTRSRYLGAPSNTAGIGTRIPILVGEHIVPGHYLSFDIDAADAGI